MDTTPLAPVSALVREMRRVGADLDFAQWNRLSLMLEAFADALDREVDLETRPDPADAEAVRNVAADEGRF